MLIVSIIAACAALIAIIGRIIFTKWLQKMYQYMSILDLEQPDDFKAAVKMVYGDPVEIYDSAFIICTERWSKEKFIIHDFSMWDTKKIIGVISMHPNVSKDEEPRINIIPKQKVFRYKDGTILWAPQLQ